MRGIAAIDTPPQRRIQFLYVLCAVPYGGCFSNIGQYDVIRPFFSIPGHRGAST
jgi:hypothetical protein